MSDLTGWSITSPEDHAREWAALPLISVPPVMTDADVDQWGEVLYARGRLADLDNALTQFAAEAHEAAGSTHFNLFVSAWHMDEVTGALAIWRAELDGEGD